ncbi:MAG TPA: flagellar biosynthetic protein FliO [Baekduia sp.]|nr:flagellar biosynthetic protein FliO [Baekduia sp.]
MKPYRALTAAFAAALLCVLLAPALALAATKDDPYGEQTPLNLGTDQAASHASVGGSGGGLARTFVGLAVVVAVIYGLTWVLRQMKKSSSGEKAHGFGLSTEASMPLGPNRSVHLIRAGRELVLVGSAEHGIVPIRTYTEDEARDLGLIEHPQLTVGDVDGDATLVADTAAGKAKQLVSGTLDKLRERTAR